MKIRMLVHSFGRWWLNWFVVLMAAVLYTFSVACLGPVGLIAVPVVAAGIVMIFKSTFEDVYEDVGMEKFGRTVFIQGGGIFPVLQAVFLILKAIAYHIYLNVKESYVIPNFSVAQIERAREFYNTVSDIAGIGFILYLIVIPVPLIIAGVIKLFDE